MRQLKMWPIVAGVLVDTFGSFAVGVAYVLGHLLQADGSRGIAKRGVARYAQLMVLEIVGLLLTAVGGFVAARMARTRHVQHGMAVGGGCLVIWLLLELIGAGDSLPLWYNIVSFVSVVPAGALGGYAAGRWPTVRSA